MTIRDRLTRLSRSFFAANQRICCRLEAHLPLARASLGRSYQEAVTSAVSEIQPRLIVDVGGGKSCAFPRNGPSRLARTLALDISEDELKQNSDVDDRVVADVSKGLPLRESSVDMVTSHMAMEHVRNTQALFESFKAVLKPGGYCIHVFACKFAPYALINQLLPHILSRKIIYFVRPEKRGICGFPAMYNCCYYSAMRDVLRENGFELILADPMYYQSPYFDFFLPFYLASVLWDSIVRKLRLKSLCAYLLVVARKAPVRSQTAVLR